MWFDPCVILYYIHNVFRRFLVFDIGPFIESQVMDLMLFSLGNHWAVSQDHVFDTGIVSKINSSKQIVLIILSFKK